MRKVKKKRAKKTRVAQLGTIPSGRARRVPRTRKISHARRVAKMRVDLADIVERELETGANLAIKLHEARENGGWKSKRAYNQWREQCADLALQRFADNEFYAKIFSDLL